MECLWKIVSREFYFVKFLEKYLKGLFLGKLLEKSVKNILMCFISSRFQAWTRTNCLRYETSHVIFPYLVLGVWWIPYSIESFGRELTKNSSYGAHLNVIWISWTIFSSFSAVFYLSKSWQSAAAKVSLVLIIFCVCIFFPFLYGTLKSTHIQHR